MDIAALVITSTMLVVGVTSKLLYKFVYKHKGDFTCNHDVDPRALFAPFTQQPWTPPEMEEESDDVTII